MNKEKSSRQSLDKSGGGFIRRSTIWIVASAFVSVIGFVGVSLIAEADAHEVLAELNQSPHGRLITNRSFRFPDQPGQVPLKEAAMLQKPKDVWMQEWTTRKQLPVSERRFGFGDYRDVVGKVHGAPDAVSWLAQNQVAPLSLALAEFNSPTMVGPTAISTPDLVTGFATPEGGLITLRFGVSEALFPTAHDWYAIPITPFADPVAFNIEIAPVFLAAGDFDADGLTDVVAAHPDADFLVFLPGNARDLFGRARRISLEGYPTALVAADFGQADGVTELAVAVRTRAGISVLRVYQNAGGALNGRPDVLQLQNEIVGMQATLVDNDSFLDLAIATTRELVVIHGLDPFRAGQGPTIGGIRLTGSVNVGVLRGSQGREESRINRFELDFQPSSLVVGNFDSDLFKEIALINSRTQQINVIRNIEGGRLQLDAANVNLPGYVPVVLPTERPAFLLPAELNGDEFTDLVAFDAHTNQIWVTKGAGDPRLLTPASTFDLDSTPVAVLATQVNALSVDGLVILLKDGQTFFMPLPDAIIDVNDAGTGDTGNVSDATICLREAILLSNGGVAGDGISTGLGRALSALEANQISAAPFGAGVADTIQFAPFAGPTTGGGPVVGGTPAGPGFIIMVGTNAVGSCTGCALPPIGDGATTILGGVNTSGVDEVQIDGSSIAIGTLGMDGVRVTSSNNRITGLSIGAFASGVNIVSGKNNRVQTSLIGVDPAGTATPNAVGVTVASATNGIGVGGGNIIGNNTGDGVSVTAANVTVSFNEIGAGLTFGAIGNGDDGVEYGATTSGSIDRNFIGENGANGIRSASPGGLGIVDNKVGFAPGLGAIPNVTGMLITGALHTIGNSTVGNLVSANSGDGILITGDSNVVARNVIGGTLASSTAVQGVAGNGLAGVAISSGDLNVVGGTPADPDFPGLSGADPFNSLYPGPTNVIINNGAGVVIDPSTSNTVEGNLIGEDGTGAANGNTADGVRITDTSTDNTVTNNRISNNVNGVVVGGGTMDPSVRNSLTMNYYFDNSGLRIDLADDGVTANDSPGVGMQDPDAGPNNQQNFPELGTPTLMGSMLTISYAVPSATGNSTYPLSVEFYRGSPPFRLLGTDGYSAADFAAFVKMITLDVSGVTPAVAAGDSIVAIVTDAMGNTSEFSASVTIDGPTAVDVAFFMASAQRGGVDILWQTENELNIIGFNVLRSRGTNEPYIQLNSSVIRAESSGTPSGGSYSFRDQPLTQAGHYLYLLEVISADGSKKLIGPESIVVKPSAIEVKGEVNL